MTTLADRPNTALLVIDVQNGVVGEAYDRDNIVKNIAVLVDKARAADVDVVWVQHHSDDLVQGSESWQYVPELVRRDSEPVVHKVYGDSFEDMRRRVPDLAKIQRVTGYRPEISLDQLLQLTISHMKVPQEAPPSRPARFATA